MFMRPIIATVAEKAASSRALEFTCTTASILTQIAVTSCINNRFGGAADDTLTKNARQSANIDSQPTVNKVSEIAPSTTIEHPEHSTPNKFGR